MQFHRLLRVNLTTYFRIVSQHYAGMQSVALKINQFYLGQDLAAKEAMMSELEKKAFYDQIPVVMHHMPHL